MGPINLDKIKQTHYKLMRLDPEYAQRYKANRKREKIKASKSKDLALPEAGAFTDNNHLQFVRFYDDTLDRLDASNPAASVITAGKPHVSQTRLKPGHRHEVDGKYLTIDQLAKRESLHGPTIRLRLKSGATIDEAIKPVREKRTFTYAGKTLDLDQWAAETGIHVGTLRTRLKVGWSLHAALTVAVGATLGRTSRDRGWIKTSNYRGRTAQPQSRDTEPKQDFLQ